MAEYVIFDFDGTLADTKEGIMNAAEYALKKFSIEETKENLHRFVGPSLWYSFPQFYGFDEDKTNLAVKYYREYYNVKGIYEASLYRGIKELLEKLAADGFHIAIVSAKLEASVVKALKFMEISDYFEVVLGSAENGEHSDKCESINRAVEKLGCLKDNAVYIGDSITDCIGAQQAGVEFIAALYDRDKSEFDGCTLKYTAKSVEELKRILLNEQEKTSVSVEKVKSFAADFRFGDFIPQKKADSSVKKYALALSGGGARGAYEIGVWRALNELNIDIEAVIGTSVGAVNGAMVAQGDFEVAMKAWSELTPELVFGENKNIFAKYRDVSGLKKTLAKFISEEKVRTSPIRYGLVTFNVSQMSGEVKFIEDIPSGKLNDYILASANHPLFERQTIDGQTYIDGGFYDNLPLKPLHEKGYQNLIAVDIREEMAKTYRDFKSDDSNVLVIKHYKQLGSVLDFSNSLVADRMSMGYFDTRRTFGFYCGKIFPVLKDGCEEFVPLNKEDLENITSDKLGSQLIKNKKILMRVFDEINSFTECKNCMSISRQEFLMGAAEMLAQSLEINELKEYTCREFIDGIKAKLIEIAAMSESKELLLEAIKNKVNLADVRIDAEEIKILLAILVRRSSQNDLIINTVIKSVPRLACIYLVAVVIMNR